MKRQLTLVILCITTLISCSKDDRPPIIQDGVYASDGRAIADPVTMYVGNVNITDRTFIRNFLNRRMNYAVIDSIFAEYAGISLPSRLVRMTFAGDSTAYELTPSSPDTFRISPRSNNTRLLVNKREALVRPQLMGELGCGNVGKYIRMNPPSYACSYLSYPNSYCYGHQQFQLNIEGDHLVIPVLTYYFMRPIGIDISCVTYEFYVNDDLNKDIFSRLRPEDTLVVQTYYIKLYKQ